MCIKEFFKNIFQHKKNCSRGGCESQNNHKCCNTKSECLSSEVNNSRYCPISRFFKFVWNLSFCLLHAIWKLADFVIRLLGLVVFVFVLLPIVIGLFILFTPSIKGKVQDSITQNILTQNGNLSCNETSSTMFKDKNHTIKVKKYSIVCKDKDSKTIYESNSTKESIVKNKKD